MLGAGDADRLRQGLAVDVVQPAGDGDDDPGAAEVADANGLAQEILQHQLGHVKVRHLAPADGGHGQELFGAAAVEKAGFVAHGTDGTAALPLHDHDGGLGNDDPAAGDVDGDIRGTQIDADIRSR